MLWNTSIVRENAFLKKSSWIISTKNHSFCHLAMKKSVLKRMKNNFPAVCEQCCVCVQRGNGGDWDVEPGWLRRWPSGIGNYWKISLLSVFFMRLMSHWFHFIKDQEVDKFGFPVTCRELKLFQWTTLFSTTSIVKYQEVVLNSHVHTHQPMQRPDSVLSLWMHDKVSWPAGTQCAPHYLF